MLKGIDPLVGPDLLRTLARMGHGDEIAIVDANFPAASVARSTVEGRELSVDCPTPRALEAVLSLLPLDKHEPDPVLTMQAVGDPAAVPPVVAEAVPFLSSLGVRPAGIERFAFAILRTGDDRPYGNFILRKGVINP